MTYIIMNFETVHQFNWFIILIICYILIASFFFILFLSNQPNNSITIEKDEDKPLLGISDESESEISEDDCMDLSLEINNDYINNINDINEQ